jgi:hypothetical protein
MDKNKIVPLLTTHTTMVKTGDCMVLIFGNSTDGDEVNANYHTGIVIPGVLIEQFKQMVNQFDTSAVKLFVDPKPNQQNAA